MKKINSVPGEIRTQIQQNILHCVPMARFGSRGATGALCEKERPGLPCFRSSWFQLTPTDPLQGMAGPRNLHGSTCMEMYLKEDEICYTGSEENIVRINSVNP